MPINFLSEWIINSYNEDIFGEERMCQVMVPDEVNDSLFR